MTPRIYLLRIDSIANSQLEQLKGAGGVGVRRPSQEIFEEVVGGVGKPVGRVQPSPPTTPTLPVSNASDLKCRKLNSLVKTW